MVNACCLPCYPDPLDEVILETSGNALFDINRL